MSRKFLNQIVMNKVNQFLMLLMFCSTIVLISSCAKDDRGGFKASDINGTWKHIPTNSSYFIKDVDEGEPGSGIVSSTGTAFPASAINGPALTKITHAEGGSWEALSHTYYPSTGWTTSYKIIDFEMAEGKMTMNRGSAVYTKQK
jgi:hypothetical protein